MKLGVNCISGTVQLAALAIMVDIEFDSIRKNTVSRCAPFETLFPADAIQSGFNSTRRVSLAIGFSTTIAILHTPIKVINFYSRACSRTVSSERFYEPSQSWWVVTKTSGLVCHFEDAFKNVYLNFTHFQLAGDLDVVKQSNVFDEAWRSSVATMTTMIDNAVTDLSW